MPKAALTSTTPASIANVPQVTSTLPTIASLGRRIAALTAEYMRLDELFLTVKGVESVAVQSAENVIRAQRDALQALISTIPAVTIEDAAIQVAAATQLVDDLTSKDFREYETNQASAAMDRLLLSALPVMAAAAGLDLATMRWDDLARLRVSRFAGVEAVQ